MKILGLFKNIGKGLLAIGGSSIGRSLITGAVSGLAPMALPWTTMALRLMDSSQKAVGATELVFKDKAAGSSSAEKKQHALDMVNADLDVYREVADATGQEFSIDQAQVDLLVEKTLDYLNQVQATVATVKMTPKVKAA